MNTGDRPRHRRDETGLRAETLLACSDVLAWRSPGTRCGDERAAREGLLQAVVRIARERHDARVPPRIVS